MASPPQNSDLPWSTEMIYMFFGNATSPVQTSCCPSCYGRYKSDNLSMVGKRALHGCAVRCWKNFGQEHGSGKKEHQNHFVKLGCPAKTKIFCCCCHHFFCLIFGCFMLLSFAGIGKFLLQPRDETCSILVSSTEPAMAFGAKCKKTTLARWLLMVDEWQVSHPEQPCWRGAHIFLSETSQLTQCPSVPGLYSKPSQVHSFYCLCKRQMLATPIAVTSIYSSWFQSHQCCFLSDYAQIPSLFG